MYKELKKELEDKKILEEEVKSLEERIKLKIQKELGLHSTTFSELKVESSTVDDKFARVFAKIEGLDNRRQLIQEELNIIEKHLSIIDRRLAEMKDVEKKVFRCRYIWGLSVRETAERLGYSVQHIKRINKKIIQK